MITVTISINGRPIFSTSAVNRGATAFDITRYQITDTKHELLHWPADGAIVLARRMLDAVPDEQVKRLAEAHK